MTVLQPGNISPHLSTFAMLHLRCARLRGEAASAGQVLPPIAACKIERVRDCPSTPLGAGPSTSLRQAQAAWSNAELARARGCSLGVLEYPSATGFRHVDDAVAIHRH